MTNLSLIYLLVNLCYVVAEAVERRNDDLVLQRLGDQHHVLAEHRLEGAHLQPQVLYRHPVRFQRSKHPSHVLQPRIAATNAGLFQLLLKIKMHSIRTTYVQVK